MMIRVVPETRPETGPETRIIPARDDALIIVDVQNDFLPGGALAIDNGDAVIAPLNRLARLDFGCVVATQDWHPANHLSFHAQGGGWPAHCIRGSTGAAFADALDTGPITHIIRKGVRADRDSYSGFFDNSGQFSTGLDGLLHALGIRRVLIGGLALDYCVAATARDAARLGFTTLVIEDACRAVDSGNRQIHAQLSSETIMLISSPDITGA